VRIDLLPVPPVHNAVPQSGLLGIIKSPDDQESLPKGYFGDVPTRRITIDLVSAGNCNREDASCGFSGVRQMSNVINFQGDAMECLRMAERAKGLEEKSVLVALARAWVLLGEQLRHLRDDTNSDSPKPSHLN
jgi:hypothetical protein